MPALDLATAQKKYLRGLAHSFKPIVMVGEKGITPGVLEAVEQALVDHELIKVRLQKPEDKKGMAEELATKTQSVLCGLVGHTVILFRPHPEKPKIHLPS